MIHWTWSDDKARSNLAKHGIDFELGVLALADPFGATRPDTHPEGDRLQTIGRPIPGRILLLLVIHTEPVVYRSEMVGRIISVRKAGARERRRYEDQDW